VLHSGPARHLPLFSPTPVLSLCSALIDRGILNVVAESSLCIKAHETDAHGCYWASRVSASDSLIKL